MILLKRLFKCPIKVFLGIIFLLSCCFAFLSFLHYPPLTSVFYFPISLPSSFNSPLSPLYAFSFILNWAEVALPIEEITRILSD